MATALPNNTKCSACFEKFNTTKTLSCGHSFCFECLTNCINDRKGTCSCQICTHDVTNPYDCPNHSKKEVDYYCQTCRLVLCSKCILKDHKDHKYLDLECYSTKQVIVEEISKSEQIIKDTIEDLEKKHFAMLEPLKQLRSFFDEACTEISEERQKGIKRQFDEKVSKLKEARQKVMNWVTNIKTYYNQDTPYPKTIKEPSLTLINSLTKLQDLQKVCENMLTDIPTVTCCEWREKGVKLCDILVSTVTKLLYQYSEVIAGLITVSNPRQIRGGSGPISIETKPKYQSSEGSRPILTVTKPKYQSSEGYIPKPIETKPKYSEGSRPKRTVTKTKYQSFEGYILKLIDTEPLYLSSENYRSQPIETKPPYQTSVPIKTITKLSATCVFEFDCKDIKCGDDWYSGRYDYSGNGMICKVRRDDRSLYIYIGLRREYYSKMTINYSVTIPNRNKDKDFIKTKAHRFSRDGAGSEIKVLWNKLTDPSLGFINGMGQFTIRID